jgi:L-serine/L-threonine ammonia-lyase
MLHRETPLEHSPILSTHFGADVWLKREDYQPTNSFKIRGIGALCKHYQNQGKTRLISSSGGNAGMAATYSGQQLRMKVTVVVPESTPLFMRERIRQRGAELIVHGEAWDAAHELALSLAESPNSGLVPPFDHPEIWRGNATLIDEAVKQVPEKPAAVVVAVGGGGLMCGTLQGMRHNRWQDVPLIACETYGSESLAASMDAGRLVSLPKISSIAKSLGAKQVAKAAFEWTRKHRVISHLSYDTEVKQTCRQFLDDHRSLVEPACGAALSFAYDPPDGWSGRGPILLVVCGGSVVRYRDIAS